MSENHDVVIVGSGPLGVAAARRLAQNGTSVLVLEDGPAISDPPGSHFRNASGFIENPDSYLPEATRHLDYLDSSVSRDHLPGAAVTRAMGGQGVIWTNLCPRCDSPWDVMGDDEWSERFTLAEEFLHVQSERLDRSVRQQKIAAALSAYCGPSRPAIDLPVAGRYEEDDVLHYTGSFDQLTEHTAKQVTVKQACVDRIVIEGHRVTGLETTAGPIEAATFVIAGGAIGTPRLLFRSGIRPAALGRYLSYHPLAICQVVLSPEFCAARGADDVAPRLQIPPSEIAEWYTLILHDVSPFEPTGDDAQVDPNRLVEIQSISPVDIDADKRAIFHEDGRVSFDVRLSDADLGRMAAAEQEADDIVELIGRYRQGCEISWMPFGFAHMTGTTRMSVADDGTGVADQRGRVWGYDNLYLATNGLIPTRMAVNPTLTGVCLAIHVADAISGSR